MFGALGRAAVGDFRGGVAAWPSTPLGGVPLGSPGIWSYVFQSFKNKTLLLPLSRLGLSSVYRTFVYLRSKKSIS